MNTPNTNSFEANMRRLDEIVTLLEKGGAPLADSLALFEEGTRLVALCTGQLDEAEQKVVKLQTGTAPQMSQEQPRFEEPQEDSPF